nr:formin-like protein 5 [Lolium perenne]
MRKTRVPNRTFTEPPLEGHRTPPKAPPPHRSHRRSSTLPKPTGWTNTALPGPSLHRTSARDRARCPTIHTARALPHPPSRRHGPPPHQIRARRPLIRHPTVPEPLLRLPCARLRATQRPPRPPAHTRPETPSSSARLATPDALAGATPPTPARQRRTNPPPHHLHPTAARIGPGMARIAGRRHLLRHGLATTARNAQPHPPAAAADETPWPPPGFLPPLRRRPTRAGHLDGNELGPPSPPLEMRPAATAASRQGPAAAAVGGRRRPAAGGAAGVWLPASPGERREEPSCACNSLLHEGDGRFGYSPAALRRLLQPSSA